MLSLLFFHIKFISKCKKLTVLFQQPSKPGLLYLDKNSWDKKASIKYTEPEKKLSCNICKV